MASGFGLKGGPGRCYPFWSEFAECMRSTDDPVGECKAMRDDYIECLHHRKEFQRMNMIYKEAQRQEREGKHGGKSGGGHH